MQITEIVEQTTAIVEQITGTVVPTTEIVERIIAVAELITGRVARILAGPAERITPLNMGQGGAVSTVA